MKIEIEPRAELEFVHAFLCWLGLLTEKIRRAYSAGLGDRDVPGFVPAVAYELAKAAERFNRKEIS
jgi:hypothetical protein